jgi:hypothetical protein
LMSHQGKLRLLMRSKQAVDARGERARRRPPSAAPPSVGNRDEIVM